MDGIRAEMRPLLRMGAPRGVHNVNHRTVVPGLPVFRSRLTLFGLIPCGHSDLTFLSWDEGRGFVEQSPMTGMKAWRHERTIAPTETGCSLTDTLTFEPVAARRLVGWIVQRFFAHRHAVLRKRLGGSRRDVFKVQ